MLLITDHNFPMSEGPPTPPPLFPHCDTNLKHLIPCWKALGIHFNDLLQKLANLLNFYIIFIAISSKKCSKTKSAQKMINYTFLKSTY